MPTLKLSWNGHWNEMYVFNNSHDIQGQTSDINFILLAHRKDDQDCYINPYNLYFKEKVMDKLLKYTKI